MPDGTIRYAGPEHVVFNGRDAANNSPNDRIRSSEGDDTLRGNGGNDRLEGGDGVDQLIGGLGDDFLTDVFGDDTLKGGDGNDYLSSGQGFGGDLNQGGRGDDFIVGGNDMTETFAGEGNDFVFAGDAEDTVFGDGGDDWIEGGLGPFNLLQGDNGAPFQDDPNEPGHDVLDSDGGEQDFDAEGGDDIMFLGGGIQRAEGMLGFDWVSHRGDPSPGNTDMEVTVAALPSVETNRDRMDRVEALSGWNFNDILRGDSRAVGGDPETGLDGHELTAEGIARINGLGALLPGATSFTGGNIILGGGGSDIIEGRGGDDVIDGDRWLNAELQVGNTKYPGMTTALRSAVAAGSINPGAISIFRSIVTPAPSATVDVAVFSDVRNSYVVTTNANGSVTVNHNGGTATDGVDTLWNIERLTFTDQTVELAGTNVAATGTPVINDNTPTEDQTLTVNTAAIADLDGLGAFTVTWQADLDVGTWVEAHVGPTFTPSDNVVGLPLRVVVNFIDGEGVPEQVTGAATQPVINVNDVPVGAPTISSNTPSVNVPVSVSTSSIADDDGKPAGFGIQWFHGITSIPGANATTYVPVNADIGQALRVVVTYTDLHGTTETVGSASTAAVAGTPPPPPPPPPPPAVPDEFVGLSSPSRVLDTRNTAAVVPAGSVTTVNVTSAGVPADAKAVSLNVTVTGTAGAGFVTVFPCDAAQPETSNLNFAGGQTIANAVLATPSAVGTICLFNSIGTELIVDIGGYLPAGFAYEPIVPVRLLDTRSGAMVPAGTVTSVPVAGSNGVAANAVAAALNVTAVTAGGNGYVTVFPCGETQPTASSLNFATGQTIPGAVLAKLGGGAVCIFNSAPTHLLVDLAGSFAADANYSAMTPTRVLDTRQPGSVKVPAGTVVEVPLAAVTPGARAVALNVTAAEPEAIGYLTVYACGTVPNASNLNYVAGQAIANTAITTLSPTGSICVYSFATTHLIIDVSGAF